jgi:hypothetical protein
MAAKKAKSRKPPKGWLDSGYGPNRKVMKHLEAALTEAHACGFSTRDVIDVLAELHKRTEFGKRRALTARRWLGLGRVVHD